MSFRTQKISQMTPKGANLAATDLIEVSTIESGSYVTRSITGQELIDAIPPTSVEWGDIGGTLSAQTDLQNALDAKVPTTRTLTINGTTQDLSADRTFTIPTGLTIGSTAIASGTIGRVLFQGTGNVLQQSSSLFWDSTNNRLGIGTSSPSSAVQIVGSTNVEGLFNITNNTALNYANAVNILFPNMATNNQVAGFYIGKALSSKNGWGVNYIHSADASNSNRGSIAFYGVNDILNWFASGNVTINTTTDAGFKLDVNGTARVKTNLKIETSTDGLTIEGDASGYPTLKINTLRSGTTRRNWMFATEQYAAGDFVLYRSSTGGGAANTQVYSIFGNGNVGINTTTDAGYKLDVNGTVRVQNELAVSAQTGNGGVNSIRSYNNDLSIATGWYFRLRIVNDSNAILLGTSYDGAQTFLYSDRRMVLGNTAINSSAILQADSTTRGFLAPRMTTTQKNAIASPATGLQVFDTTLNQMSYYNGTTWVNI